METISKDYNFYIPEITLKYKTGTVKKVRIQRSFDSVLLLHEFYDQDTIELTETVIVLFLNNTNDTIGWMKLSTGGLNSAVVDLKLIMITALKCVAHSCIISHNHPSNDVTPSKADKQLISKLQFALSAIEIKLIDSIIISDDPLKYFSFVDAGLIN